MTRPVILSGVHAGFTRITSYRLRFFQLVIGILLPGLLLACRGESGAGSLTGPELAEAERLYVENCATCHGVEGEGRPNWQEPDENGVFPAPPHNNSGHTWHHSDSMLLQIIAQGGAMPNSGMPGFAEKLTQGEMEAILAYIKTFWDPEIRDAQADVTRRSLEPPD